jgi:outer membrane protein assembly factor BamB
MIVRHACPIALVLAGVLLLPAFTNADAPEAQWCRWRGPAGTGHSVEKDLPVEWTPSSVVWKTALKGNGQSSPIIWEDRIFLTSSLDKGKKRLVFCLDRNNGKLLWEHVAWEGTPEPTHKLNGFATPSCVTDGERVYGYFGKAGLHCYTVEGKHLWSIHLGEFLSDTKRGTAASPVLAGNLVIVNGDSKSDPYLFGIDKLTGKTVWKVERPATEGYSTPIPVTVDGREELVVNGHYFIAGYEPATGKQLWSCKSFAGRGEPTPTLDNGILYVINGQPGDVYAVRPGGDGDVTQTHMVWHVPRKNGRDQPSPIVVNGFLVISNIAGVASCYEAATGKELWKERISAVNILSSPVAAGGYVYFLNEAGETIVLQPGKEFKIAARNKVVEGEDDFFRASLTPYRGQFFVRSNSMLYCVGKK